MARPKRTERFVPIHVNLPELLVTEVDLHLMNPLTLKREYAALGKLIEQLLYQWLEERRLSNAQASVAEAQPRSLGGDNPLLSDTGPDAQGDH